DPDRSRARRGLRDHLADRRRLSPALDTGDARRADPSPGAGRSPAPHAPVDPDAPDQPRGVPCRRDEPRAQVEGAGADRPGAGGGLAGARRGSHVSGRVIVVGSLNVDLVVTGERLPAAGETVTGGQFERFHGGKGGNQAVAAARLGAETWFI